MSQGDGHESFIWENQTWVQSNSDNSAGVSEEKTDKKLPDSSTSNSQTPTGTEPKAVSGKKRGGASKNGKGDAGGGVNEGKGGGGDGESDHEMHIWTERERRKKMRNMFSSLHALLPQLPAKADKSTIVDEAVTYIRTLQHSLQKLQKQKLAKLKGSTGVSFGASIINNNPQSLAMENREAFLADQGSSSRNLVANSSNSLSFPRFPATFQTWTSLNVILNVCGEDAHISVCSQKKPGLLTAICYVLEKHKLEVVSAHVSSDHHRSMYMIQAHANGSSDQFSEAFPVEEIYKQAAGEISMWVTS